MKLPCVPLFLPTAGAALALALIGGPPARAAETFHACTGFIDSVPATITTQGVWCLRRDLSTAISSGAAITIAVNNVTLDCNGFKLGGLAAGNASLAHGVLGEDRQNLTVRNCSIRGFYRGIELPSGAGHLIEDNRFDNNLRSAISGTGANIRVRRNAAYDTGGASGTSVTVMLIPGVISDNVVSGAFAPAGYDVHGIYSWGRGSRVQGNHVSGLTPSGGRYAYGIMTYPKTPISGNSVVADSPVNGAGIHGAGPTTTPCQDNLVVGFSQGITSCDLSAGGNVML